MARASDTPKRSSKASGETKLAVEKLATSGLTLKNAIDLGMEFLSPDQTSKLHNSFDAKASIKLNYFDLAGQKLKPRPKWPAFYRIRYLENESKNAVASFSQQAEEKPKRYTNEPEAGRHAASLRTRLFTSGLWDFCREVGVPFDRIADAVPVDGP